MKIPISILVSALSSLIPILGGLFVTRWLVKEMRILFAYLIASFLVTVIMYLLAAKGINNLWLMHLFTPVQFGCLIWVFSFWATPSTHQRLFWWSIPSFFLVWAIGLFLIENINHFNSFTRPLEAVLLILASSYVLFQENVRDSGRTIRRPQFWVGSATVIYFTGMVILYSLSNVLLKDSIEILGLIWSPIQMVVNIAANCLYAGAFLCLRPRSN